PRRGNREGRRLRDSPRLRHERADQPVSRGPSGHGVLRPGRWLALAHRCGLPVSAAIPGIVLAAGASRRMGRPKALLPLGASGLPFVRVICDMLTAAGVSPIVVVTRAELLESLAGGLPDTKLAVNRDPERGQLSSLLAGLDLLGAPPAAMMTLVDLPLVQAGTVAALLAAWGRT